MYTGEVYFRSVNYGNSIGLFILGTVATVLYIVLLYLDRRNGIMAYLNDCSILVELSGMACIE